MTIQRRATTIRFFKYIFTHFETIVGKLASVLRQRKKNVLDLEIFPTHFSRLFFTHSQYWTYV